MSWDFLKKLQNYEDPNSLGSRLRRARFRLIKPLIQEAYQRQGVCRILDIGGTGGYWRRLDPEFLLSCRVEITLLNLDKRDDDEGDHIKHIFGDACTMTYRNDFDFVHANSVIEHVGDWARMADFARNVRQAAPSYYLQTPNYAFPYEPHYARFFVHWRSDTARAHALVKRSVGFMPKSSDFDQAMRVVESTRLLNRTKFKALFPDAEHVTERFFGLPKSLIAIRRIG